MELTVGVRKIDGEEYLVLLVKKQKPAKTRYFQEDYATEWLPAGLDELNEICVRLSGDSRVSVGSLDLTRRTTIRDLQEQAMRGGGRSRGE